MNLDKQKKIYEKMVMRNGRKTMTGQYKVIQILNH